MTRDLPTLAELNELARDLREELAAEGVDVGHTEALEMIAQRNGFQNWSGLRAAVSDLPAVGSTAGERVSGRYLTQRFSAKVLSAEEAQTGWFQVVLDLDEAVDVIEFEGMSNWRKRIHAELGSDGRSRARTSDGRPHVELDLEGAQTRALA